VLLPEHRTDPKFLAGQFSSQTLGRLLEPVPPDVFGMDLGFDSPVRRVHLERLLAYVSYVQT
jgi:hypothetical protein